MSSKSMTFDELVVIRNGDRHSVLSGRCLHRYASVSLGGGEVVTDEYEWHYANPHNDTPEEPHVAEIHALERNGLERTGRSTPAGAGLPEGPLRYRRPASATGRRWMISRSSQRSSVTAAVASRPREALRAAPLIFRDNISVPTIPAVARARRHLDRSEASQVTLVATGGIRTPADMAKALALGADAVALSNSAMQAIGCVGMRASLSSPSMT